MGPRCIFNPLVEELLLHILHVLRLEISLIIKNTPNIMVSNTLWDILLQEDAQINQIGETTHQEFERPWRPLGHWLSILGNFSYL